MEPRKDIDLKMEVNIAPLDEQNIEKFDPILRQHVRDRQTDEILEGEINEIKGYMRGEKDEEGRTRKYLVAKTAEGKILGCMAYTVMDPDMVKHFSDIDAKDAAELVNAFVDSEVYRGGGVGRKLFEAVCNVAKSEGKKNLTLNSGPRYKSSWGFYDHLCDEDRGFIVGKFGPGGDAKTWLKKL